MVKVIEPSHEIIGNPAGYTCEQIIELAARTCYKSASSKNYGERDKFIGRLIDKGHHSVLEHAVIAVKIICDRGVSHELVRHRLASYSQESTRYVNYKEGLTVIKPCFWPEKSSSYQAWLAFMQSAELAYRTLIQYGASPQEARSVLPTSLKTEVIMTANLREWRHVFKLRCSKAAHPQMREIMVPLHNDFADMLPAIFKGEEDNGM